MRLLKVKNKKRYDLLCELEQVTITSTDGERCTAAFSGSRMIEAVGDGFSRPVLGQGVTPDQAVESLWAYVRDLEGQGLYLGVRDIGPGARRAFILKDWGWEETVDRVAAAWCEPR